jgi:hypothetical protein
MRKGMDTVLQNTNKASVELTTWSKKMKIINRLTSFWMFCLKNTMMVKCTSTNFKNCHLRWQVSYFCVFITAYTSTSHVSRISWCYRKTLDSFSSPRKPSTKESFTSLNLSWSWCHLWPKKCLIKSQSLSMKKPRITSQNSKNYQVDSCLREESVTKSWMYKPRRWFLE